MLTSTRKVFEAAASADPSITSKQIKAALAVLADADPAQYREPIDRLLSRKEAAAILSLSPKSIDVYCRRGVLQRVKLGTSSRASGILESSVRAVMESATLKGGIA